MANEAKTNHWPSPSRWWTGRNCQQSNNNQEVSKVRRFSLLTAILVAAIALLAVPSFASAATWSRLGGDPLFVGGIQGTGETARQNLVHDEASSTGQQAMRLAGLNSAEVKMVVYDLQTGKFVSCRLVSGMHFEAMSYGTSPMLVDRNVTYNPAPGYPTSAPAFCITAVVEVGDHVYTIHILIPQACANFSVESITVLVIKKPKPKPTPTPKPKKATREIYIRKIAEDSTEKLIAMPTGIFHFSVAAKGYPTKTVTLVNDPQGIGSYKVGTKVTIKELTPSGSIKWVLDNPKEAKTVSKKEANNTFVFKNVEKPTATPAAICNDSTATNYGQVGVCVYNACHNFDISGEYVSGNVCAVNVCGVQVIITGNNNTVNINANGTCGPPPPPGTCNDVNATNNGGPLPCQYPPSPTISFTLPQFNEINAGANSNPQYLPYVASEAGGSITITPNVGGISTCGGTEQSFVTFTNLSAGNGSVCFVLTAPNDANPPANPTMDYTVQASLGTDVVSQTSPEIGVIYTTNRPS